MDNMIVGATGAICFLLAQYSTNVFESMTPLGIIAIVVYYFLIKFDKKLDKLEDLTVFIKKSVTKSGRTSEEQDTDEE